MTNEGARTAEGTPWAAWPRRACARSAAWLCLAGLLCLLLAGHAPAALRDYTFHTLDHRQGLAQSSVTALLQDRDGFLWVATQAGLQRYDGYRFRPLTDMLDLPDSAPRSFVTALAEDDRGQLWLGTQSQGVFVLDATRSRLTPVATPPADGAGARRERIDALTFQPGAGMWLGSSEGVALLQHDGRRDVVLRFRRAATADPHVHGIAIDSGHLAWAATDEGLFRFAAASLDATRLAAPEVPLSIEADADGVVWVGDTLGLWRTDPALPPMRIWPIDADAIDPAAVGVLTLAHDSTGVLWASLSGAGLLRFDPSDGSARVLPHQPGLDGGAPDARLATATLIDRSDLLWIGGNMRGVALGDVRGIAFETIVDLDPQRDRLATNFVRALHEGDDGALWIGTEGDGLKRYDLADDRFDSVEPLLRRALADPPGRNLPLRVQAITATGDGGLWVSTDRGLFRVQPPGERGPGSAQRIAIYNEGFEHPLRAMLRRRDGSLWLSLWNRGIARFDPADGSWQVFRADADRAGALGHPQVLVLFEDASSRLWAGSMDGLDLFEPDTGTFRRFRHDPADEATLSGVPVRALHQSPDGTLWVGSHNGLDRLVERGGSLAFARESERLGLQDRIVYGIAEDAAGMLWLSGHGGLTRLDRNGGARRFGLRAGLQDLEFNGGATLMLRDGRIAFGGVRGINVFRPEAIKDSRFEPPLALIGASVGEHVLKAAALQPGTRIDVPQSARVLHLVVASLDFGAPAENRFAFRLDGYDADWIEAGAHPHATYTNLAPGDYLFRARATNRDGVWSPRELHMPVRVVPPWWNSTVARASYLAAAAALVLLLLLAQRRRRQARRELMEQLREREERLKLSLWGSGDEFWDWDVRANQIYRMGADQLLGMRAEHEVDADEWRTRAVHPDDLPRVQQILQEHILGKSEFFESEHRIRNAHGEWIWVRSRGKVVERDADHNPLRIAGTAHDISATRRAERERRIASEVLRSMSEAVAVTSLDFRFVSVNASFSRITGYEEEEVIGLASNLLNSSQNNDEFYRRQREAIDTDGHWKGEMWLRRRDGDEFLAWIEVSQVGDSGGRTHYVAVLNDITDKKRAEQELRYLANYDTLTGLPNRSLLAERLARAVVRARRMETHVAVLFLDLDRFKDINDSLGHAAGDRILKSAAARLLRTVGETDTVARLGGDEFTVVIEDVADVAAAEAVAEKILLAFGEPLDVDGRTDVAISPSIGISLYPDHGLVPTDLLKFADTAMYQAKDRGRNTYQVYTEAMDAEARRRAVMIAALRKALDRGEFSLEFQPRLSLIDGRISGVEALLRWNSSELGSIPPSTFIPIAEETGLILPIGEWVIREACMTLQRWNRHELDDIGMAVNVSVLQLLRGKLPETLRRILSEIDIPPARLELEVTESMVMANAEQTISVLRELKDIGVSIAIDDFGTGYSSLIYLKRLPIDTLKIDKEFVGDLTNDPDDEAITATVITMAHSLGLNVVAEGVETEEQLMYLREQGCDEIQGFWLSPPLDVHHCLAFLRSYRAQPRAVLPTL